MGGIFVKGIVCPVKIVGRVLICNLIKTSPPAIFLWAQAAPTRYRNRSHCFRQCLL